VAPKTENDSMASEVNSNSRYRFLNFNRGLRKLHRERAVRALVEWADFATLAP
jgi:hypothetical protein